MRAMSFIFFCLASAGAVLTASAQGQQEPSLKTENARVELERKGNQLSVMGVYENTSGVAQQLSYRLITEKTGQAGRSKNSQGGRFSAVPEQEVVLARVRMNVQPKDQYTILLQVYNGSQLVAEDIVEYHGE